MGIDYIGEWPDQAKAELSRFAEALAIHPRGGQVLGRMVMTSGHGDGRELREWMKPGAFTDYMEKASQQPVVASGKTFVAHDDVVTVVVSQYEHINDQLVLCSHELIEMAGLSQQQAEGWEYPEEARELLGIIFFDEYAAERLREEIARDLGWNSSDTNHEMAIVELTDQIQAAMPTPRYDPPWGDFWAHWQTLARMWCMACGRRSTNAPADAALKEWAKHPMIAESGWVPVEKALGDLYETPELTHDEQVSETADRVWDPIEAYGRKAWSPN